MTFLEFELNALDKICEDIYRQGYSIIEDFLPVDSYRNLLNSAQIMNADGVFRSAKIGRQFDASENTGIRGDKISWLNPQNNSTAVENYFSTIQELAKGLNQAFFLGLHHIEAHFAVYPPGTFYRKHIDQFQTTQDRRISCVYYLNEDWQETDGGELKLYNEKDELLLSLLPTGNRFICFNSNLPHEVCETQKNRYSITGWLKVRSMDSVLIP